MGTRRTTEGTMLFSKYDKSPIIRLDQGLEAHLNWKEYLVLNP